MSIPKGHEKPSTTILFQVKRKLIIILVAAALVAAGVVFTGGWMLVDYAFRPQRCAADSTSARFDGVRRGCTETIPWIDSLQACGALRDTFLTMPGGYRGHAIYVKSQTAHGHTAILVHGYKDSAVGMMHIARIYNEVLGWNILLPDLYAHGLSEGDHIRMGWFDRKDVIRWANAMEPVFRSGQDSTVMVLHGVSMGAATVMYCSGDKQLPAFVKGVVEDCGFSDVWTELRLELHNRFNLPAMPLLYSASIVNKMRHSWRLGEASAVNSVSRSTVPMLFIHGAEDTFVPKWMAYRCYEAKQKGEKTLWIASGSEHANSYKDHKTDYIKHIKTFAKSIEGNAAAE